MARMNMGLFDNPLQDELFSLDKATIHDLYNFLKAYKGNCGRTDKDMEKMYKTDIKDMMIADIELLSKEVSWIPSPPEKHKID